MKYCIFKDKTYTGLAYNEINDNIKDFHKDDLIVPLETAPLFKCDKKTYEVIEAFKYSDEEYEEIQKSVRVSEIQIELKDKFMDAQLKCVSEELVFAEKYPELANERIELLKELNLIEGSLTD